MPPCRPLLARPLAVVPGHARHGKGQGLVKPDEVPCLKIALGSSAAIARNIVAHHTSLFCSRPFLANLHTSYWNAAVFQGFSTRG